MSDIANIYTRIGNIQTQINAVTGNTSSNYNQTLLALTQQANISTKVTSMFNNSTTGNLNSGNIITSGNIQCRKISTLSSQLPFRIEYGTTDLIDTGTSITFSTPFTVAPTVFITGFINSTDPPFVYLRSVGASSCFINAKDHTSSNYGNLQFNWMAIGR